MNWCCGSVFNGRDASCCGDAVGSSCKEIEKASGAGVSFLGIVFDTALTHDD